MQQSIADNETVESSTLHIQKCSISCLNTNTAIKTVSVTPEVSTLLEQMLQFHQKRYDYTQFQAASYSSTCTLISNKKPLDFTLHLKLQQCTVSMKFVAKMNGNFPLQFTFHF